MSFTLDFKPRFHEIDRYDQLHHSVYFWWLEAARIAYLEHLGVDLEALHEEGYHFVLVRSDLRYKKPVRAGMAVKVTCEPIADPVAKLDLVQRVLSAASREVLVEARIEMVAVKRGSLCLRLPSAILDAWHGMNFEQKSQRRQAHATQSDRSGVDNPAPGPYRIGKGDDDSADQSAFIALGNRR